MRRKSTTRFRQTDRSAEHNEVQGRGYDWRENALKDSPPGSSHFEKVNRLYRVEVHESLLTRLTKIASSEL